MNAHPQLNEAPLDWLIRIAPDDWETSEDRDTLVFQSGDRRIVVSPLEEQASFDERIGGKEIGSRWRQRELVEGQWYLQTTAGLLLWGIGDETPESEISEKIEVPENEDRDGIKREGR